MKNFALSFSVILLLASFLSFTQTQEGQAPDKELISLARGFVDLLAKEDFSNAVKSFDSVMTKVMPQEKLKQAWDSVKGQVGAFKRQAGTRIETLPKFKIVFVTCEFEIVSLDIKVVFNTENQVSGLWFAPAQPQSQVEYQPPAYVKSDSFSEKEVIVGSGEWALPGTLTLPQGRGPFPAVVLVHGSGPQDRDEAIGPNKPFRDLAWGLASQKIAALRYEKRTKVHSRKLLNPKGKLTVKEETIDDALAALDLLGKTEKVDAQRIFILGHSLGGMLAPRIGALDSRIRGLIIMAGTTRYLEDVILDQVNYIIYLDGKISEEEKSRLEEIKAAVEKIKNLNSSNSGQSQENILGAPAEYWLDLRGYNPAETAGKVKQPMLILQGGRDYQVTIEDFNGWKKALSSRKDVEFRFYPELNHLFIEGQGTITPEEYQKAGHIAKKVIDDIARWIHGK